MPISDTPAQPQFGLQLPPFDTGGERRAVVSPYSTWRLEIPGTQMSAPTDVEFALKLHPAVGNVVVVRPKGDTFSPLGRDVAEAERQYSLQAFGDGTAWIGPLPLDERGAGATIFIPGVQFDEQSPFSIENSGFWRVTRLARGGAYLRREGPGGVGVTETITASAPSDLQLVLGADCGKVLAVGAMTGLFKVAFATGHWMGLNASEDVPETENAIFERFEFAQSYISQCLVQVDQLAIVRVNSTHDGIVLLPTNAGIESGAAHLRLQGYITTLQVQNLSADPMKLRVVDELR